MSLSSNANKRQRVVTHGRTDKDVHVVQNLWLDKLSLNKVCNRFEIAS